MNEALDIWGLVAGFGLFLFGMRQLERGLQGLAGARFRRLLRLSTARPILSVGSGILATTLVQSSSLVGLIVLAMAGAQIIPLVNAIGVVIGANLGTTFTGWIVTTFGFKVNFSAAVLPLLGLGGLGYSLFKGRLRSACLAALGFAFLLMGLAYMKDSAEALTQFLDVESIREYPLLVFFLVGVVFTAIIQSSSATMMLTLSALNAGLLPLESAAALIIGADLGTTSTVLLGSVKGAVVQRRIAASHFLFNFFVDLMALALLHPLIAAVQWLQVTDPLYSLVAFHSLFNVIGIVVFLPFIEPFSRWLERRITEDTSEIRQFINNVSIDVPSVAVLAFSRETEHLLLRVAQLNVHQMGLRLDSLDALIRQRYGTASHISRKETYRAVKRLEGYLVEFAAELQEKPLTLEEVTVLEHSLRAIRSAVYSAKSLRDIRKDLKEFALLDSSEINAQISEMKQALLGIYTQLISAIETSEPGESLSTEVLDAIRQAFGEVMSPLKQQLYERGDELPLGHRDLSTLLNVEKELSMSTRTLLEGFAEVSGERSEEVFTPI